jgi:hypothetical protein
MPGTSLKALTSSRPFAVLGVEFKELWLTSVLPHAKQIGAKRAGVAPALVVV